MISDIVFFFKQKTAYEIYQCDWSSDVCSSDLCFNKYPLWVVKRVLEYGTLTDVLLLIRLMGKQFFLERVSLISFSSVKTEQFWSKMLNREGFTCTKKHSPKAARSYWPA